MPKMANLKKILLLGAGPVVIGHGTEYDYAALQVCRVLKEAGCEVILVNNNPASLATDPQIADRIYMAPLTIDSIRQIIAAEKPDGIFAGYGGQTALNLLAQLKNEPWLQDIHLDIAFEVLERTQNREKFRDVLSGLGLPQIPGGAARNIKDGLELGRSIGFPLMVHPSYSLAGSGSAVVYNQEELEEALTQEFDRAPSKQLVVEKALLEWEETEWELLRDHQGKIVWIAVTGKIDPAGIHIGNSMTFISSETVALEKATSVLALVESVMNAVGVIGSANLKIASDPLTGQRHILDLNPRFSFNAVLASEITGVSIAELSTKIALGYSLTEIEELETLQPGAPFGNEEIVAVKVPRFDFKRFSARDCTLGPAVKAVGETVVFGGNFKETLQKAVRALGVGRSGIGAENLNRVMEAVTPRQLKEKLLNPNEERLFYLYYALQKGMSLDEVKRYTKIGLPILEELAELVAMEKELSTYALYNLPAELLLKAKMWGYSDQQLAVIFRVSEAELRKTRYQLNIRPAHRAVDHGRKPNRCYTITYGSHDSSLTNLSDGPVVLMVGSFDSLNSDGSSEWGIVHAAEALKALGRRVILAGSGSLVQLETTAFDRIYFEPLTLEGIVNIIELEAVNQVILQFGGASALELAGCLSEYGVALLGTALEDLVDARQPEKLKRLLERLRIPAALQLTDAVATPNREQIADAVGLVAECIGDGSECRIAGIMEQIEAAEIHPGDSALSIPPYSLDHEVLDRVAAMTETLMKELAICGWASFRFAVKHDIIYLLELNPWAGSTVAFISKATGTDWAGVSARVLIGQTLKEQPLPTKALQHTAVKEAVFSFTSFPGMDTVLGPVKRSSGMVMGIDEDFGMAFVKSQLAAGEALPTSGKVYLSIRNEDKRAFISIAEQLVDLGFDLVASDETAAILKRNNIQCEAVYGVGEGRPNILDMIKNGQIQWVINTPSESLGKKDERLLRSTAVLQGIPIITTLSGALAAVNGLKQYIRTGIIVHPMASYFKMEV